MKGQQPNIIIIDELSTIGDPDYEINQTVDPIKDDWRPIPGFEAYEINRAGEVWSTKSEQFMNTDHGRGHWVKMLHKGKRFTRGVPKLIDLAFPEFKKITATDETDNVLEHIKKELDIDLELWQVNKLKKWLRDQLKKKAGE